MNIAACLSSADQTWATPQAFFNKLDAIFYFYLDPCAEHDTAKCAIYYTKEDDGLKQPWLGNVFVNPPFGPALKVWMRKCQQEAEKGLTVVMLIPARPDTSYWHDIAFKHASHVCFIRGRIKFGSEGQLGQKGGATGAPFPSAIVVFNGTEDQAAQLVQFGKVFKVK